MITLGADKAGSGPRTDERGRRREPGQKRSSRLEIDGWINLDKPTGVSSTQAVGRLKFLFNAKKAGHAGTLDPLEAVRRRMRFDGWTGHLCSPRAGSATASSQSRAAQRSDRTQPHREAG